MPIVYACGASHAPGITAWTDAASRAQNDAVATGFAELARGLEAASPDTVLLLTSEHWANFFLDHASAFCVGRGDNFTGPVEPWLKVDRSTIPGHPGLALRILDHCYGNGFELSHSHELELDHGSIVPLHFLTRNAPCRIVPVFFNTLCPPRPTPRRCLELGRTLRPLLEVAPERIAVVATGGLSHDPGEVNHGVIDTEFDARFLARMTQPDLPALAAYTDAELLAAGAGTMELLAWLCLAGIMGERPARTVAYEAVKPWATGIGMISYDQPAAARAAA